MEKTAKPACVDADVLDEMLEYLDDLRDSGETNMNGAPAYLRQAFLMEKGDALTVFFYWKTTFEERHPAY